MTKLQEVQERLAQLDPNNRDNLVEIARLNTEIEQLKQADRDQAVLEKNHEQRVQTAKDEFNTYIQASLDDDGITLGEIFRGETQQQLYTIKCSQAFNALVSKLSSQLSGAEERELQLKRQNDELQDKFEALEAELRQEKTKSAQYEFERNEALKTRDNAASALEEAKGEIDRLNSQVDDLRKEIAVGARNSYKVVDAEGQKRQMEELIRQVKESRIKVINMRPMEDDFKRQNWQAEDALTGETYTFNYLDKGKYTELNENEVQQFRLEQAQKAADAAISLVSPALPTLVTEQQFPSGNGILDHTATDTEDGDGTTAESGGSSNDASISRAEFEALEARVTALENVSGRWAS